MAHKKAGGSTSNLRDSQAQRLGIKIFGGQKVKAGGIIVRQRGTKFHPGLNTQRAKDDSIFSKIEGIVKFTTKKVNKFSGNLKKTKYVDVLPNPEKK